MVVATIATHDILPLYAQTKLIFCLMVLILWDLSHPHFQMPGATPVDVGASSFESLFWGYSTHVPQHEIGLPASMVKEEEAFKPSRFCG